MTDIQQPASNATVVTLASEEYWELLARFGDVEKAQHEAQRLVAEAQQRFHRAYVVVAVTRDLPKDGTLSMQWNDETKELAVTKGGPA